ncbi:MAG TPA: hypothetical protein DEQ20_10525 [Desulfobulbaceae bacterium]|nr:hypothetical protein [Desulfobulbaceae bacterium]
MEETHPEKELLQYIYESKIFSEWHYYAYHFRHLLRGYEHPFAQSIVNACLLCENKLPGFAKSFIDAIASISGREKYKPHYEQLLQRIAELHILQKLLSYEWPFEAKFKYEPTTNHSRKNPELTIEGGIKTIGVEVKAPSLLTHRKTRSTNPTQISARIFTEQQIEELPDASEGVTYPRDNPVKDFLISAEEKFKPFNEEYTDFSGVLVIVWDDYIYEPITALIHEGSGLFTGNSFALDNEGNSLKFLNVDGVIIISHLHQLIRAAAEQPLVDSCRHPLDYGLDGDFPQKVFISNPNGNGVPDTLLECLQAYTPTRKMGAEYSPSDLIWWIECPIG